MTDEKTGTGLPDQAPRPRPFSSVAYSLALKAYAGIGTRLAPRRGKYTQDLPIRVEGFHGEVLGIGETARQFHRALTGLHFDSHAWTLNRALRPENEAREVPAPPFLRLSHLNPDQLIEHAMRIATPTEMRQPHTGYWVWELPVAPRHWRKAARLVDRIWTPSEFSAQAIRRILPEHTPVAVLPPPVFAVDAAANAPRPAAAANRVLVLALCDLRSSMARKNPLGALGAFERASASAKYPAHLVLKVVGASECPEQMADLVRRCGQRRDVSLMTENLSDPAMLALIRNADIALCLHRSEGFGLLAAHAALAGRTVVATNWSAPTEFLNKDGAALVDYRLVPVQDDQNIYPRSARWAEPDADHAAQWLERLISNADLREEMGRNARLHAQAVLGPERWAERLGQLLAC